jgi:hypothetical protein
VRKEFEQGFTAYQNVDIVAPARHNIEVSRAALEKHIYFITGGIYLGEVERPA